MPFFQNVSVLSNKGLVFQRKELNLPELHNLLGEIGCKEIKLGPKSLGSRNISSDYVAGFYSNK